MAEKKISLLSPDTSIEGTEVVPASQGGSTKKVTIQQIADFTIEQVPDSGGGAITIQEEGVSLATAATTINFVGAGVTASGTGATKTITIPGGGGSSDIELSTPSTFTGSIKFDKMLRTYEANSSDITAAITVNATGAVDNGGARLIVTEDGGGEPTLDAAFSELDNTEDYDTTDGNSTAYIFNNIAGTKKYGRIRLGVAAVTPTLSQPTFEANATSDTEIALSNIVCDPASEAMIIRRATNIGMTANLTTVYSGVPVTDFADDELTASTTYSYDILTTAAGYNDSPRSDVESDTTDATGLTPLPAPANFTLIADEWGKATGSWDNVTGNIGFSVQIATNAGFTTGVQSATKGTNVLSHQFTGLSPLVTYYGHSLAIGNGTTNSNSAYSTTDSDTTPAATLNACASFAAGTPTADGVPFTWTDTNAAPANESSSLIQIAAAADTGYSSVIATRTPAADATSAAAGTGLAASTAYRARKMEIGNGTSTLDSGWSSEVTFTTAAAPGLTDFTYSSQSGTIPESPTGTYTLGLGEYMVSDEAATGDCIIEAEVPASGAATQVFGLDTNNTLNDFYQGSGPYTFWEFYIYLKVDGKYWLGGTSVAGDNEEDSGISYAAGHKYGIYRVGGVWKAYYNSGSGNVDLTPTATTSSTATVYNKASGAGPGDSKLVNPKGQGFA